MLEQSIYLNHIFYDLISIVYKFKWAIALVFEDATEDSCATEQSQSTKMKSDKEKSKNQQWFVYLSKQVKLTIQNEYATHSIAKHEMKRKKKTTTTALANLNK